MPGLTGLYHISDLSYGLRPRPVRSEAPLLTSKLGPRKREERRARSNIEEFANLYGKLLQGTKIKLAKRIAACRGKRLEKKCRNVGNVGEFPGGKMDSFLSYFKKKGHTFK